MYFKTVIPGSEKHTDRIDKMIEVTLTIKKKKKWKVIQIITIRNKKETDNKGKH